MAADAVDNQYNKEIKTLQKLYVSNTVASAMNNKIYKPRV
jgi:hypothetical protein